MKKYDVTQKPNGDWQGRAQDGQRASVVAPTKAEAVKQTIQIAKKAPEPVSVKIHKSNGRIQEERTYPRSADPSKSEG